MVAVEEKDRKRKFHRKTKGACDRCRARHVRCGLQRPVCHNCQQLRLSCGWQQVLPTLVPISLDANELRSFCYWRENTGADLRGCVDERFWNIDLLRLSHESKYLEHFVVSMSSLDEAFRLRTLPDQEALAQRRYAYSLINYQKAIGGFLEDLSQPKNVAVVLASCLVCIAMELWQGDIVNATHHVLAGCKIAREALRTEGSWRSTNTITETLLSSLWRYYRQMKPVLDGERCSLLTMQSNLHAGSDISGKFYEMLDQYLTEADVPLLSQSIAGAAQYLERLERWYNEVFEVQKGDKRSRERHLLASHYHAVRAMIMGMITDDEMQYDDYVDDFRQILAHCSAFLKLDRTSQGVMSARRAPDATINMTLFLAATKCRQPRIRREALRLLYQARRLEGLWSSTMLGAFAEMLVALEEDGEADLDEHPSIIVPPARRRAFHSFRYEPRVVAKAGNSAIMASWVKDAPFVTMGYSRSHRNPSVCHTHKVYMKPYMSTGEFGMKSVFWWPQMTNSKLLDEEIPEATKSLDGPHLGYHPFYGSVNTDLKSALYLRFLYLSIGSTKKAERT